MEDNPGRKKQNGNSHAYEGSQEERSLAITSGVSGFWISLNQDIQHLAQVRPISALNSPLGLPVLTLTLTFSFNRIAQLPLRLSRTNATHLSSMESGQERGQNPAPSLAGP